MVIHMDRSTKKLLADLFRVLLKDISLVSRSGLGHLSKNYLVPYRAYHAKSIKKPTYYSIANLNN